MTWKRVPTWLQTKSPQAGSDISTIIQFAVIAAVMLFNLLLPDTISVNNGFGYDGFYRYKQIILDFPKLISHHGIVSYNIQRVLPFAVIHYSLKLFGLPFS